MEGIISDINQVTPVTQDINGVYLKRDDLFMPYEDLPIRGNKVRQLRSLIKSNLSHIKRECDGNVYVGLFSSSCQSVVLARVIKELDPTLNLRVFHGGMSAESVKKNKLCLNAIVQGASIDISAKSGYNSVIQNELNKRRELGENFFNANLSYVVDDYPEEVLFTIAEQARNLPKLDNLYVPLGSGYTMAGVIIGIKNYGIGIKNVVGISVSDTSAKSLCKVLDIVEKNVGKVNIGVSCLDCNLGYHKKVKQVINDIYGVSELDYIYEGKSYKCMLNNMNKNEVNGFWVSGNMNGIRDKVYGIREALK